MDVKKVYVFLDADVKEDILYKFILKHTDKIVFYNDYFREIDFELKDLDKVLTKIRNKKLQEIIYRKEVGGYKLYCNNPEARYYQYKSLEECINAGKKRLLALDKNYSTPKYYRELYKKLSKMPYKKREKKYKTEEVYNFRKIEGIKKISITKYCICEPSEEMLDYFINEFRCFDINLNGEHMEMVWFIDKERRFLGIDNEYYYFTVTDEVLKEMDALGIPYVEY